MTYDQIVQGLRDSIRELQNEGRLVRAGLKTEQDTASIAERYGWLYSDGTLDAAGFYSADYLRAWLAEAALDRRLPGGRPRASVH